MKRILWLSLLAGLLYSLWMVTFVQTPRPSVALGAAPAQSATAVRFAVIGDYGVNNAKELAVSTLVKSWNPDLVLTLGDNNYPSGQTSTMDSNVGKYYQQFIYPYLGSFGTGATENRFFAILGNHDWESIRISNSVPTGAFFNYFTLPGNERYYDFVRGPVHFFALDSDPAEPDGITSTSIQATWLRNQLSQSSSPWKIVYLHHSPYSSSSVHGSTPAVQWPFKAWGADIVFSAHDHLYERLSIDGLPYIVGGFSGASLYTFGTTVPGSQVRYNTKQGAVLVNATTTSFTLQAFDMDGALIDTYQLGSGGGNLAPNVSITSPTTGATVAADTPIQIMANASDTDGTVTQVLFQANGNAITGCTDSSTPYQCSWTPVAGTYTLTAIATDNSGATTLSQAVNVTAGTATSCTGIPALVINELMYFPATSLNSDDWVEIYNPTGSAVSLANWILQDSTLDFVFPTTISIPANGYIVAVKDRVLFTRIYPTITGNIAAPLPFRFSNTGEVVRLLNPARCLVDEVTYAAVAPWPTTPAGTGPSLSLLSPSADNSVATNWSASSNNGGTPNAANGGGGSNQAPTVQIPSPTTGATFTQNTSITMQATASDSDGTVQQVTFLDNGTSLPGCIDSTAPYVCVYTPGVGTHSLTAVATDNLGATTTSAGVNITVSGGSSGGDAFLEQGGLVVMEAENFDTRIDRNNHSWQSNTSKPGFIGLSALFASPNNGGKMYTNVITTNPEIQYRVQFSTTGNYYVWLRTWADGIEDNSIYDGIDGVLKDEFYTAYGDNLWTWSVQSFHVLTPGIHTISLWMREDGLYVDRLLMTRDGAFRPSGNGPPESGRASRLAADVVPYPTGLEPEDVDVIDTEEPPLPETDSVVDPGLRVSLVNLRPESTFITGETIALEANVETTVEEDLAIPARAEVLFFANDQVLTNCDVTSAPHRCAWSPPPGSYLVMAVAFVDSQRLLSAPVTITVSETIAVMTPRTFLPLMSR